MGLKGRGSQKKLEKKTPRRDDFRQNESIDSQWGGEGGGAWCAGAGRSPGHTLQERRLVVACVWMVNILSVRAGG